MTLNQFPLPLPSIQGGQNHCSNDNTMVSTICTPRGHFPFVLLCLYSWGGIGNHWHESRQWKRILPFQHLKNQPTNQPTDQSTNRPIHQTTNHQPNQPPTKQPSPKQPNSKLQQFYLMSWMTQQNHPIRTLALTGLKPFNLLPAACSTASGTTYLTQRVLGREPTTT